MTQLIYYISFITIIATFLPLWQSDHWLVRGQTNLKQFYFATNIICIVLIITKGPIGITDIIISIALLAACIFCLSSIWRYSVLAPVEVYSVKTEKPELQLKIFVFNVYQKNTSYNKLVQSIVDENPDIVLLLETNEAWEAGISELYKTYTRITKDIRDDTYGLMFLSKLPIHKSRISYLINSNIPSGELQFKIQDKLVRIIGLHPMPPIPGESLVSTPKDQEIIATASYFHTLSSDEAHILIGDFNEVAWSRTSTLFRKITGMKDPRIGRGTYATFPSYLPIKFPLDHVYCSSDFHLVSYLILDSMGSDHHAVSIQF